MTAYIQGVETVDAPAFTGVITLTADARIVADDYAETTGDVWSITNTPGSAATVDIVKITAAGANWSGGSCLYLNSADTSVTPLTVNSAGLLGIELQVAGAAAGYIKNLSGGGLQLSSSTDDNIQFLPNGTGITHIGDAGATSHSLASNDDEFVAGKFEVDGTIFQDGAFVWGAGEDLTVTGLQELLADDGSSTVLAHASTSGWGFTAIGDNQEWARFRWSSDGTVALEANSANVANSDSDTDLCIYSTGGNLVIKNRLGAPLDVVWEVNSYAV